MQIRSDDVSPDIIGNTIIEALHQMRAELKEGALLIIDAKQARIRMLPLLTKNNNTNKFTLNK